MTEAKPYPKETQLARGPRKYRRHVASQKGWQAIADAKRGPCRICPDPASNGHVHTRIQFHHVVPKGRGGDDYAANIVPLCPNDHERVTNREPEACRALCTSLTDAEYAYAVGKCGEDVFERVYRITYGRES